MLVFMDGFDCYGADGNDISSAMSANGWVQYVNGNGDVYASKATASGLGYCMSMSNQAATAHDIRINLPALTEFYFGFRMNLNRYDDPGVQTFFQGIYDNSFGSLFTNFQLIAADNGAISVVCPGTSGPLVSSNPGVLQNYAWHFVEGHVVIDGSNGTFTLYVDGAQVLTITGVQTKDGNSPAKVNQLGFYTSYGNGGEGLQVDDFYVCDTTGTSMNTYLGDNIVYGMVPISDAGTNQMTQVGGTSAGHYTSIDTVPANGDTSYLTSNVNGATELFNLPNLPAAAIDVLAVQVYASVAREAGGIANVALVVSDGTNTVDGSTLAVANSFGTRSQLFANAPDGGAWTVAKVNTPLQVGLKVVS